MCPARQSTCLPRLWAQLPESCQRGIWVFTAAQHSQCAAKEKREPSPHISVPAQPTNCAGPLQLPALKHFSAAEARRVSHSSGHSWWRHKSRALFCCFLQGSLLPCSSDRLCHPWMRVGWGILEADTARAGSWLRHEQVTGQNVVTKKPFCSGVPPKCTLGIV